MTRRLLAKTSLAATWILLEVPVQGPYISSSGINNKYKNDWALTSIFAGAQYVKNNIPQKQRCFFVAVFKVTAAPKP